MQLRTRALALGVAASAASLAGCTAAANQSVTIAGKTLTIYLSAPAGASGDQRTQDVLDAERLAFAQLAPSVTSYAVKLRVVSGSKLSDSARTAIEDTSAIAYLGELAPGSSADSAGITNFENLLQVSPTDTAIALTQASAAVPGSPNRYYESLKGSGRTFARVVPNAGWEAAAQVAEMRRAGVKRLYVADDGSDYGKALGLAIRTRLPAGIVAQTGATNADAVFFAGRSATTAAAFFNRLAAANPRLKLFAPSALASSSFAAALSPSLRSVEVSSPGFFGPGSLPATAQHGFIAPFQAAYHHAPAPEAIFGYEAMAAVLAVLHEDGSLASSRSKVVHDFFAIRNRDSVLGRYSIDASGDTTAAPFVFSGMRAGKLVPLRFVRLRG